MNESHSTFIVRKGKHSARHSETQLRIGTRLGCELVLDDPIAAGVHATMARTGDRFVVRPGEAVTGTLLNGLPIEEETRLSTGDVLVLGVTRISLRIDPAQSATLELVVEEKSFHYTAKTREEFASDADEWVRSEVRFGRFPALRWANGVAGLVLLALIAWLLLAPDGEDLLAPGPLTDAHAGLFDPALSVEAAALASGLPASRIAAARADACAACHTSFEGAPASKCLTCHDEYEADGEHEARHPFVAGPGVDCAACHREHTGHARPLAAQGPTTTACSDCHGSEMADRDAALAAAVERYSLSDAGAAREYAPSPGFEGFGHGPHQEIACETCHAPDASGQREFAPIEFTDCASCHAADASDAPHRPGPEFLVALDWHGAADEAPDGTGCTACHVAPYSPALRPITVADLGPDALGFEFLPRSHAADLDAHAGGRACVDCHVSETFGGDDRGPRTRPFLHADHLSHPIPTSEAERATALSECAACHVDRGASRSLADAAHPYTGPDPTSCAECHVERDAREPVSLIRGTSLPATTATVDVPDFDHARHAGVQGGCFACHGFEADDGERLLRPYTAPEIRDCTGCHLTDAGAGRVHTWIGGSESDCALCHSPSAEAELGRLSLAFYAPPADDAPGSSFSHATEGHASADCASCHGTLDGRDDEILVPGPAGASCRDCHSRRRFHWR